MVNTKQVGAGYENTIQSCVTVVVSPLLGNSCECGVGNGGAFRFVTNEAVRHLRRCWKLLHVFDFLWFFRSRLQDMNARANLLILRLGAKK